MLWLAAAALAGLLVALAGLLLTQVDDWSRDLTVNVASTAADAADERLRPLWVSHPPEQTAQWVEQAASRLPRWQLAKQSTAQPDPAASAELHFIRTTPWLRFKDDITVTLVAAGEGTQVNVVSRSRVGRGDLGQNPRNIRELLDAVRADLQASPAAP